MIAAIFEAVGDAITNFAQVLGNGFNSLISIFYTTGENGGLTLLGTLLLIGMGVGVVYWAFNLIRGLVRVR